MRDQEGGNKSEWTFRSGIFYILLFSILIIVNYVDKFQRELDGYKFPVYTTESCPENEKEWNRKSSAFNCSKESSYACFPNNETTELIEFCYPLRIIIIPEGSGFSFCFFKKQEAHRP